MRRRRYLAAFGAGVSGALAGCSESSGEPTTAGPETGTAVPTNTSSEVTTRPVSETFEMTNQQGTATTLLNEIWGFSFSVRNRTDTSRTFRSTLSQRVDGEWRQFGGEVSFDVGPGAVKTWQSPPIRFRFLGSYTYRLDALETTWTVEVRPLSLEYGLAYTSPVGLEITVGQVTFRDERPRASGNETATATGTATTATETAAVTGTETAATETATETPTATRTPPPPTAADRSGTKWAVVPITVENPTDQARSAPFPQEFTFRADGETYPDVPLDHPDLFHRDRSLEPGEPLSGNLYYEIPAGTDANTIEIVLQRSYSQGEVDGDIEVVWSR